MRLALVALTIVLAAQSVAAGNLIRRSLPPDETASMTGYWSLDESSGDRDLTAGTAGTDCDLTQEGTVSSEAGILGNAASFPDTNSDRFVATDATCDEVDATDEDVVVCTYFRMDSTTTSGGYIIENRNGSGGWDFWYSNYCANYAIDFEVHDGTTVFRNTDFPSNECDNWVAMCGRWDDSAGTVDIMLNGTVDTLSPASPGVVDGTQDLRFGNGLKGELDEAWIDISTGGALTDTELRKMQACGPTGELCRCRGDVYVDRGFYDDESISGDLGDCDATVF